MIFVLLIGLMLFVVGGRITVPVLLFYMEQERSLYFESDISRVGMARLGGTLTMAGGSLVSLVLLPVVNGIPLVGTIIVVSAIWWISAPRTMKWLPPRWVRQFEEGRSAEELRAIMQNGAALLYLYPEIFRQIIRDKAGWDTWITTITGHLLYYGFRPVRPPGEVPRRPRHKVTGDTFTPD